MVREYNPRNDRMTAEYMSILEAVYPNWLTAEEVLDRMSTELPKPSLDRTSTSLKTLHSLGLVERFRLKVGGSQYRRKPNA